MTYASRAPPGPWWRAPSLGQACPPCSFSTGTTCLPCPPGSTMDECIDCEGGMPIQEKPSLLREYGPEIVIAIISATAIALAVPGVLGVLGRPE